MAKKICIVGGEDVHKRIPLSKYLIDAGYNVTIIGSSKHKFPENTTYVSYSLNRNFAPFDDYKTLKWYKSFFTKNNFDLIHTFDTKPAFLVPLALRNTKTPISRTITGLGIIFNKESFSNFILRKFYFIFHRIIKKRVSKTIFQNSDNKNLFLDKNLMQDQNYDIIYSSGIELNNIKDKAIRIGNPFTFICVSRLIYEKGIINYLEAAKICRDNGYNFKFLLVGPLEENSSSLNEDILKNHAHLVEWLGQRNDILNVLSKSDAFVLPTFYGEGFPRVLLEAAAVGLPIISTNVTGVREFGKHQKDFLLIEPKNSKILAETMIILASDKQLCDTLAEDALNQVEEFSLEKISNQYIAIFDSLIKKQ
ncbi:glycosyltransferase [Yeosuana sp. MJ-SS3]|uniref:Glycosyltransferase n=1 Tax=Gilvirhabdus luticola TaxID=3079858 RepID=A0ABU3U6W8_9FLAO|nr:glycosyltransferase [Yeosuana sp. MJ-SS3]MDU8886149.1 glycosyltransferase [Yeosuana sp. MJ-SS3]